MKIEKEIQQKKFKDEYQKAAINIAFTASWIMTHNAGYLKPFGISPQQYNILRILKGQHPNPVTVKLLTERMIDKMSNASRLVEKLKQKGLVERCECEKDRRQVDICISNRGLKILAEMSDTLDKHLYENWNMTKNEAKELNKILDKMRG